MQAIYKKLIERYKIYLPAQRSRARVGEQVARNWFVILSAALMVFFALVGVGTWIYFSIVREHTVGMDEVTSQPMPLSVATIDHIERVLEERISSFEQVRMVGIVAPDPGRAPAPTVVVDDELEDRDGVSDDE